VWSHDGNRIFFTSVRPGGMGLNQMSANGAGQEELLYQSSDPKFLPVPTPAGKFILFENVSAEGNSATFCCCP
jgi:Tol biopolymer transport system component